MRCTYVSGTLTMTNYQLIEVTTRTTPSELTTKPGAKTATESSTTKITTTAQEGPSISTNMGADCVIPNNNYDALVRFQFKQLFQN